MDAAEIAEGVITVEGPSGQPIPVFPIPDMSMFGLEAVKVAKLENFYHKNEIEFSQLVAVAYASFMDRTKELREWGPEPADLYDLFFAEVKMIMTAASPQSASLGIQPPQLKPGAMKNMIAFEFLWNHLEREDLKAYQDLYGSGRGEHSKVERLIDDFIHYMILNAFESDLTILCLRHSSKLMEACRVIEHINRGEKKLRAY